MLGFYRGDMNLSRDVFVENDMKKIDYEITDAGICLTDCPRGYPVKVGSMSCTHGCQHYRGEERGEVRCGRVSE